MVVLAIRRELEKAQVKLRHPRPQQQQQQQQQQAVQQSTASQHDAALLTALRSRLAALSHEELKELLNEEDEEGVEGEGGLDTLLAGLRTDFPALGKQCCGSGCLSRIRNISIPDSINSILTQKIVSKLSEILYDTGCSSRLRIPYSGVKNPDPQHCR
jgi:hypothetical protein